MIENLATVPMPGLDWTNNNGAQRTHTAVADARFPGGIALRGKSLTSIPTYAVSCYGAGRPWSVDYTLACAPGDVFNVSYFALSETAGLLARIEFLAFAGAAVGPALVAYLPLPARNVLARLAAVLTIPAGMDGLRFNVNVGDTNAPGLVAMCGGCQVTKGPELHPYFDGNGRFDVGDTAYKQDSRFEHAWTGAVNGSTSKARVSALWQGSQRIKPASGHRVHYGGDLVWEPVT